MPRFKALYGISASVLAEYYNICGAELDLELLTQYKNDEMYKASSLYEFSPFRYDAPFSYDSQSIDENMQKFLERSCEIGQYGTNESKKMPYYIAFMGILQTATNINLIPEDSKNFLLLYLRLDVIISNVLKSLLEMSIDETIQLFNDILTNNAVKIALNLKRSPILGLIILLAMCGDSNLKDYEIFKGATSYQVDSDKLIQMAMDACKANPKPKYTFVNPNTHTYMISKYPFVRLSYEKTQEYMKSLK